MSAKVVVALNDPAMRMVELFCSKSVKEVKTAPVASVTEEPPVTSNDVVVHLRFSPTVTELLLIEVRSEARVTLDPRDTVLSRKSTLDATIEQLLLTATEQPRSVRASSEK